VKGRSPQPGHDPGRDDCHCAAVLEFFRGLPRDLPNEQCPSTQDLIAAGRFGVRPPNRINNLIHGKYDGHCYDFERISCGRGVYRWRLHEPARPGYPKHINQVVLELTDNRAHGEAVQPQPESQYMARVHAEEATAMPLFGRQPQTPGTRIPGTHR